MRQVTVYLLHFARRMSNGAQHYVGMTARADVQLRLGEHRAGRGARLTKAAARAGVEITLARTWEGVPPGFERQLKRRGGLRRLCPVCRGQESAATRQCPRIEARGSQ